MMASTTPTALCKLELVGVLQQQRSRPDYLRA
jgi:hypothetical protein